MHFLNSLNTDLKENLRTKYFIILITTFYIFGLWAVFGEHVIGFSISAFIISGIFALLFDFGFKRTLLLFLIFILGILRADKTYDFEDYLEDISAKNVTVVGKVISSKNISNTNNKIKFYLDIEKAIIYNKTLENLKSKILVVSDIKDNEFDNLTIGDKIEIKGNLKPPKESTNPYQFNYKRYLLFNDCKNILYGRSSTFKIVENPDIKSDLWYFILNKFEFTRNKILKEHSKNIKSPHLEILGGIVFGNETINPDEKIKENFKNSGLLHLLAASGLNVALIYGIWWQIAMMVRIPFHISIFIGAIFVILYTFMTGFPPSILRASIMILFVLFGKLINRDANSVSLVFFVGFLILLFNPKMLYDVGFQLSFMVTIGLVVCVGTIIEKFENKEKAFKEKYAKYPKFKRYIIYLFSPINLTGIVLVPLVAQLWVIPLQMHYFNNLAPLSVLANIAVVPFIGILSFIGFASSIIALIPILNTFVVGIFDFIANPLLALLIKISAIFSSFKYSLISTASINIFQMFGFWAIILILTLNIKNDFKNKKHLITLVILIIIFSLSFIKTDCFNKNLEIVMFDVYNADCFLIKTPKNKYIMIDTAKSNFKGMSNAKAIIIPYIKNHKIKNLELLIITHFDIDHAGGTIDILNSTKAKTIILQKENDQSAVSTQIKEYLNKNNLKYKIAQNNETIYKEDNLTVKTFKSNIDDDNENSIVTLITYKNKNYLFMADTGVLGYNQIKNYLNVDKIDILKIGHHGARNVLNENMINSLKPDYALISAGENSYNHPHFETTNLLDKYLIETLITKYYGFVKIVVDNDSNKDFFRFEKGKLNKIDFSKTNDNSLFETKWFNDFQKSLQTNR